MMIGEKGIAGLVSEARELGVRTIRSESDASERVAGASKLLVALFQRLAKDVGGFRGQTHAQRVGTEQVLKIGDTDLYLKDGALKRVALRANFVRFWKEVPTILSRHVAQLERDNKEAEEQVNAATESYWTLRAVIALMDAPMSGEDKNAMIARVLKDVELQQAMDAARDTGEDGAQTKLLSDQGNNDDNE